MLNWFLTSLKADPVQWIAIFVAIVLSGVFWRTIGSAVRWLLPIVALPFKKLANVRLTTKDRVVPHQSDLSIPARWWVGRSAKDEGWFGLQNTSIGSAATNVRLEVAPTVARLRSGAVWPSLRGGETGWFEMSILPSARSRGITFLVIWDDAKGTTQTEEFTEGESGVFA